MSLRRVFLWCFAAGIVAGYLVLSRSAPAPGPTLRVPEPRIVEETAEPREPLIAAREPSAPAEPEAPPPNSRPRPVVAPADPTPLEQERAKADELAASEPLTPEDVRVLLEQVLAGKLPRELTARDYDRLTDVVMRVRAAERVLKGLDETAASAEVRAQHRDVLTEAIAEVHDITGLQLAELTAIVDPRDGLTREETDPALSDASQEQNDPH